MKMFILLCNMLIPVIMIAIAILYRKSSNKKAGKLVELFISVASIGSGVGKESNKSFSKNDTVSADTSKKYSRIWSISGILTLILTAAVLGTNYSEIINSSSFLDNNNISVIMLEVELLIVVLVFVTTEYILKKIKV